jgi:hypothetical protein
MFEKLDERRSSNISAPGSRIVKKTYLSPSVVEYGSVAKLTQNGAGSGVDNGTTAGMMHMCL